MDEKKATFYAERKQIITDAGERDGSLPLDSVMEPRIRLLASLSLIEEGFIAINPVDEGVLELTRSGQTRFTGLKALSNS